MKEQFTETKTEYLKGDKVLWIVIILISMLSVFPVYSASSNLEYIVNNGTTTGHVVKHIAFVFAGLIIMRSMAAFRIEKLGAFSILALFGTVLLLLLTFSSGQEIGGASASRWLRIPGTPISFQPSAFAYLMLIIYICRFLTKNVKTPFKPAQVYLGLFLPVAVVFLLVFRDNGSTALMIVLVSTLVMALGRLKLKYIFTFFGAMSAIGVLFLVIALNTDWVGGNRVHTWKSRIETFTSKKDAEITEEDKAKTYQTMQARAAIVHGGTFGIGPGKSALKQTLPQSVSDFIFAIIVEEYGLMGAGFLIFLYVVMIFRIVTIASKVNIFFGSLLVLSLGLMIFVQLAVNIAVALSLMPVTGQPLPLISYGGTSMLVTYFQLGLILNVSNRILTNEEEGLGKKQSIEEINDIA